MAKKNENKTPLNAIVSIVCALLLIAFAVALGRNLSFRAFYGGADDFRDFALSALSADINIRVENGRLKSDALVNSFENAEDEKYRKNGYDIIVDSRETERLYDDFTMICRSPREGLGEIAYEKYLTLPSEQKKEYTSFRIKYSGRPLDISLGQEEYKSYLEKVADEGNDLYNKDIAKTYSELNASDAGYEADIYELYILAYYPTAENAEKTSPAPTIHGYYTDIMSHDQNGNYIVLLSEICYVSFTSRGVNDIFLGNYSLTPNINSFENEADTDEFIKGIFASTEVLNYYISFLKTFDFTPLFALLIALGALSLILLKLHKRAHPKSKRTFGGCMQIIASFGIISGAVAALSAFIMSFLVSQITIFSFTMTLFILTLTVRSALFIYADMSDGEYDIPDERRISYHFCDEDDEEYASLPEESDDE